VPLSEVNFPSECSIETRECEAILDFAVRHNITVFLGGGARASTKSQIGKACNESYEKLSTVAKPREGRRTVIESKVSPAFRGEGDTDYICGGCGTLIADKVRRGQIRNIVVQATHLATGLCLLCFSSV